MRSHLAHDALLVLEDGSCYPGRAVAPGTAFGEVVFNTSMTGYQEILTDPSYRGQIVAMTQPHMGNYGTGEAAAESARPWAEGFVVREATRRASGTASAEDLPRYLARHRVPAIEGIDTRALVRRLRELGALRGVVTSETSEAGPLAARAREFPRMEGKALALDVGTREPYEISAGIPERTHLALYDFGAKSNIARCLAQRGARVTVVPATLPASRVLDLGVDGVVLSNGPGDPEPLVPAIDNVRFLLDRQVPILGICLGHQLLGLALGARTYKLKFGHHGGNQPVRRLDDGKILITSQNHGFAVDPESLPRGVVPTEINLNDGTLEAFAVEGRPVVSAQYHPEAAPGPHDAAALFDRFLASLPRSRAGATAAPVSARAER
jgi:carbamoyl-phosphate synthase small subunit